jgi:hypothetical protein
MRENKRAKKNEISTKTIVLDPLSMSRLLLGCDGERKGKGHLSLLLIR